MSRLATLVFAFACLLIPTAAHADSFVLVEAAEFFRPHGMDTAFNAIVLAPISPVIGVMGYGFVSKEYAEAYAGPAVMVGPLKLGAGLGVESHDEHVRAGLIGSLELEEVSLLGFAEAGGSGPWAALETVYHASHLIGIGTLAMSDAGVGPRLEITPLGHTVILHGSMMYGWWDQSATGLVGLRAVLD